MRGMILLLALASGCMRIEIEERNAFDAKRTVSDRQLSDLGVKRQTMRIEVEPGVEVSAWHLRRRSSRGTILYFGGNGYLMVNGHDILQGIAREPADVFTYDYRGYGESDGEPSVAAMKADAIAVYDHLTGRGFAPDRIVLFGQSLGSFVALWVASQRPSAAVVLETPVTRAEDLLGHLTPWWTRPLLRFDVADALRAEDNLARIASMDRPLLVFAGAEDRVAHPDMARALFRRAPGPDKQLEVFPGGSHNDLPPRDDYQETLRVFLDRVLPKDPAPRSQAAESPDTEPAATF